MKGKAKLIILLGGLTALLLLTVGGLAVAANPEDVNVQAPVASTIRLTITGSPLTIDFGGSLNPETGSYAESMTATVRSNVNWELQVEKDEDLTGVNPANVIPSNRLTFTSSNPASDPRITLLQGSATQFGLAPTMVAQGTKGNGMAVQVNYALTITWDDEVDNYSAVHTYTGVAR